MSKIMIKKEDVLNGMGAIFKCRGEQVRRPMPIKGHITKAIQSNVTYRDPFGDEYIARDDGMTYNGKEYTWDYMKEVYGEYKNVNIMNRPYAVLFYQAYKKGDDHGGFTAVNDVAKERTPEETAYRNATEYAMGALRDIYSDIERVHDSMANTLGGFWDGKGERGNVQFRELFDGLYDMMLIGQRLLQ